MITQPIKELLVGVKTLLLGISSSGLIA